MPIANSKRYQFERSLLGCLLIDNGLFIKVVYLVSPQNFRYRKNALIYAAMCSLVSEGAAVDVSTLMPKLREWNQHQNVGGAKYLAEILEATVEKDLRNWNEFAEYVAANVEATRPIEGADDFWIQEVNKSAH